jgi:hypothetical protein
MPAKKRRRQPKQHNLAGEIVKYFGGCLAALIVVGLLINLYDPKLRDGAATAMLAPPSYISEKENAYFSHYGLGVAANEDPHAYGVRYVAASNAWLEEFYKGSENGTPDHENLPQRDDTIKWQGAAKDLCAEPRVSCMSAYAKQRTAINRLARDNALRLTRYRSLHRYKQFQETVLNRMELNSLPALANSEHETVLAQIALNAIDGNMDRALRDLAADTMYWRRVLAGTSTLLVKVVAANYLSRNYALASEIASRNRDNPDAVARLAQIAEPLSTEEKSWSAPLTSEFHMLAHMYVRLGTKNGYSFISEEKRTVWDNILAALFYKPNATINRQYAHFKKILQLADTPAHAFAEASSAMHKDTAALTNPVWTRFFYNPLGNLFIAMGTPDGYPRYIGRTHNLDGQIRLFRVQLNIYKDRVAPKDIESYLERQPPENLDPFRNQAFRWEASARELWFEGIPTRPQDEAAGQHRVAVRI